MTAIAHDGDLLAGTTECGLKLQMEPKKGPASHRLGSATAFKTKQPSTWRKLTWKSLYNLFLPYQRRKNPPWRMHAHIVGSVSRLRPKIHPCSITQASGSSVIPTLGGMCGPWATFAGWSFTVNYAFMLKQTCLDCIDFAEWRRCLKKGLIERSCT